MNTFSSKSLNIYNNLSDFIKNFNLSAFDTDSNNKIPFTDFVVCYSITSFGNLRDKIELAFKIYDLGKILFIILILVHRFNLINNKDKNKVIDKNEMHKVIEALYDMTGVPENERKGDNSPKRKVEEMIHKLDKNFNNVLEFDEFLDGCLSDDYVRNILVDPMFNC